MLRKVLRIAGREFTGFFSSPAAFLFLAAFLGISLFVFFWVAAFFERNIADVRPLFQWMPVLLIFLVAALTMRAWAEERRAGTLELLLTTPTRPIEHVLGKFVGCLALVLVALLLTLPLPITVSLLGPLDWGPVVGGYAAAVTLAAAYVSIGLWISCRTDNQIVSLILTVLICGAFYLIGAETLTSLVGYRAGEWLRALGAGSRFNSITRGVLDLRDIYYYLSVTAVFLALNRLSLERLRWAGNPARLEHRRWYWVVGLLAANLLCANLWLDQVRWARVDLTAGRIYTLSDATRTYVGELQEPLLIRGYFSAATHPLLAPLVPQLRDLLQEYAVAGGNRVRVEFVDPHDDPAVEAEAGSRYGIRPVPFQVSSKYQASVVNSYFDVLIAYGDQFQVLTYRDLIDVKAQSDSDLNVELKNPEYAITSAIRKVLISYQGGGSLFDTVHEPLTFTGYLTATAKLPEQLQVVRSALEAALKDVVGESGGKFKVTMQDPDDNAALTTRLSHDYGFRPMVVSLLDPRPFWFYLTLSDGRRTEQVPLPDSHDQAGWKEALEAAVKRFSPGFLKTLAVMSPTNGGGPMAQFGGGGGQSFSGLRETLGNSVRWLDTDLKNGQVPADADMLLALEPEGLDTKQVFAIDQFLMQGGTVVLASAPTDVSIGQTVTARPVATGLEQWLGSYGLSYGKGMVLDAQSGDLPIPVERDVGGYTVNELELAKYPYIIDVRDRGLNRSSPITRSLGQIDVTWAAPLEVDPKRNEGRRITDLLQSSPRSWVSQASDLLPDYTAFPDLGFAPGATTAAQPLGVMLEGEFESFFKGKPSPLLPTDSGATADPDKTAPAQKPDVAAKGGKSSTGGATKAKSTAKADPKGSAKTPSTTADTTKPATSGPISSVIDRSPDSARLIVISSSSMFSDPVINLIGQSLGTRYTKPAEFAQNIIDWAMEDQSLLTMRSREHFARTLEPLTRRAEKFWEYLNYGLALGGLLLVWLIIRQRRRRAAAQHLKLLQGV